MTRRRRRVPWWVSAPGLTATLAAAGWLMAAVVGAVLRIAGAR